MALMQVTPNWKSGYNWLALLAYTIIWCVSLAVLQPESFLARVCVLAPCVAVYYWLTHLASKAQFEADWAIPKKPRIDINE